MLARCRRRDGHGTPDPIRSVHCYNHRLSLTPTSPRASITFDGQPAGLPISRVSGHVARS